MGTKLQYSSNPFGTTINNNDGFGVSTVLLDDWDHSKNKGLNLKEDTNSNTTVVIINFEDSSMDRRIMLTQQNIESIKKTMLMHQDIFQHQVQELHRLYSAQKMLMDEMRKNKIKQDMYWGVPRTGSDYSNLLINRHQPTTTTGGDTEFNKIDVQRATTMTLTLRLTNNQERSSGSCCGETLKIPKGFDLDLERAAQKEKEEEEEEDISSTTGGGGGGGVGACEEVALKNNNNNHIDTGKENEYDDETDVELTLSIRGGGCCRGKKNKSKSHQYRHHHA